MKLTITLLLVALAAISDSSVITNASSRANLIAGNVAVGDRLLYRSYIYQPAILNAVQYQDVVYRGNATTRISAIQATEVGATQRATARILSGGIRYNNVTVRFTSARGYGYYYLFDIYGR